MQLRALIVDSFRESLDRKIFWVLVVITLLVAATMFCVGFEPDRVNIMFGMWELSTDLFDPTKELGRRNIANVAVGCMDVIVGWIGLMFTIIATAGFFPSFLERGAADVLLSKPMSRTKLFLGKYLGSTVFVLMQAALFGLLTFAVIGFRWRVWLPAYLLSVPLMVILFSYLYCISAWVGIATRSSVAAIFICIGAWVLFSGIRSADDAFELYPQWKEERAVFYAVRTLRWAAPKTQDIAYIAKRWTGAGSDVDLVPPTPVQDVQMLERLRKLEDEAMNVRAVHSIGSSLAFEGVVLLLALWSFSRKDF